VYRPLVVNMTLFYSISELFEVHHHSRRDIQHSTLGELEVIVLHFGMREEIILSILLTSVMWLHSSVQDENIMERINVKCHPCTLMIDLLTIV
jgi:hypothetical protein